MTGIKQCSEFTLFTIFLMAQSGICASVFQEGLQFCQNNGFNYVTYVSFGDFEVDNIIEMSNYGIQSRYYNNLDVSVENMDFLVLNFVGTDGEKKKVLDLISSHRVQRSLLITQDIQLFKDFAAKHLKNSLFFLLEHLEENISWKQILIINDNPQVVINDVEFDIHGFAVVKQDLNGLKLVTTSMAWAPFLFISDCDSNGWNCTISGFLADLMFFWEKQLNFSLSLYQDKNGDWGTYPKSGKSDKLDCKLEF